MTPSQTAAAAAKIIADTDLSAEARVVVLHVLMLGDGEHEISHGSLSRLLNQASEKKVSRAVRDAQETGWLSWRRGGKGHNPVFSFNPAKSDGLNTPEATPDNPAEIDGLNDNPPLGAGLKVDNPPQIGVLKPAVGGGYMGGEKPPPPPSPKARTRDGVENSGEVPEQASRPARFDELREWLGPDADAADAFAPVAGSTTWAAAVIGTYGPNGTQEHAWNGTPPERRPKVVAEALRDYTIKGRRPFDPALFRGFVRTARDPGRIAPDSEAAQVLASPRDPTPGANRNGRSAGFATAGSAIVGAVPHQVLERIREGVEEKLGPAATPEEKAEETRRRAHEWTRHHGQPALR